MLLIKALHIISVMSWLAGLLYLPRLLVYHATELAQGSAPLAAPLAAENNYYLQKLQIMERRLLKIITTPAMLFSWIFGIILLVYHYGILPSDIMHWQFWLWVKLACLVGLTIFHIFIAKCIKKIATENINYSAKFFRFANEIPTCLMIIIVLMVVLKPF